MVTPTFTVKSQSTALPVLHASDRKSQGRHGGALAPVVREALYFLASLNTTVPEGCRKRSSCTLGSRRVWGLGRSPIINIITSIRQFNWNFKLNSTDRAISIFTRSITANINNISYFQCSFTFFCTCILCGDSNIKIKRNNCTHTISAEFIFHNSNKIICFGQLIFIINCFGNVRKGLNSPSLVLKVIVNVYKCINNILNTSFNKIFKFHVSPLGGRL